MKASLETYKIWAPQGALWTEWAKPVLFMRAPYAQHHQLNTPKVDWAPRVTDSRTMIIVDMPGEEGVLTGLGLAQQGYRPVPLYNGVYGPNANSMIVNVGAVVKALYHGAEILDTLSLRPDSPPAFLLDSTRMSGFGKAPGKYDNRWCVFAQDMPSAAFLQRHGIHRVVVRAERIQNDLSHILCRYQKAGVKIELCGRNDRIQEVAVVKPSEFQSLRYRIKVMLGLTRNAAGGFGGQVPEPTQSSSGTGYYGIG